MGSKICRSCQDVMSGDEKSRFANCSGCRQKNRDINDCLKNLWAINRDLTKAHTGMIPGHDTGVNIQVKFSVADSKVSIGTEIAGRRADGLPLVVSPAILSFAQGLAESLPKTAQPFEACFDLIVATRASSVRLSELRVDDRLIEVDTIEKSLANLHRQLLRPEQTKLGSSPGF